MAKVPWSVHVLKMDRSAADLELHSTLGKGTSLGVGTLTEQLRTLPPELGEPVAAINADFAKAGLQYQAHPVGLQIMRGALVSSPCQEPCFWIDANGQPQATNVLPRFQLTWPNNQATLIGLNDERTNGGVMLYTAALGTSTRTARGREMILERDGDGRWLPLRPGEEFTARVREVRETGNSPLSPDTLVLSLSQRALERAPVVSTGAVLKILMDSIPSLRGVRTAIGGTPVLLRAGKTASFNKGPESWLERHPRTAVGWNDQYLFLVVVDGRQRKLSLGMTLPELASYMAKLGCREAMNLDGGGSSTFWFRGQVRNTPCEGRERPMVNALVLVRKPAAQNGPQAAKTSAAGGKASPRQSPP